MRTAIRAKQKRAWRGRKSSSSNRKQKTTTKFLAFEGLSSQIAIYYANFRYYRNANKREIMKAYRKLAQKWHPDNYRDEDEKARAQAKFIDLGAAKEVLTDPEKREKFDHGEDPLDPSAQQAHQQGWHHFHSGFGGGFDGFSSHGQQYTFKFTNF